jgi:hypothetical protein
MCLIIANHMASAYITGGDWVASLLLGSGDNLDNFLGFL